MAERTVTERTVTERTWQPISTAPSDVDLELAVLERGDVHPLIFRCRRSSSDWINAETGRLVDVRPTHWRKWQ